MLIKCAWHGSITTDQALSLERVQAGVARCLPHADWMTPKHQMLEQIGWPALRWRRSVASITLFHQLKIQPPSWLEEQAPPTSTEKEIVREAARGDKPYLRKSAGRKVQIMQEGVCSAN